MAYWSERTLIQRISSACSLPPASLLKGIGDDCCEISTPSSLLLSMDTLVDGIHFDRSWHPPRLLGRKSVAVNLSDIAAMGAQPLYVLFSLCLPPDLEQQWIDEWLSGAFAILQEYDTQLIGGDTVKGKELVFSVTVLGKPLASGSIYRSGAAPGDTVWVSGSLGAAGAGLELLSLQKERGDLQEWAKELQPLIAAHLDPVPRVEFGLDLARSGLLTAMQDISDGIATDLAHICHASGVSAYIIKDLLPMLPALSLACDELGRNAEDFILRSGEDYELLFTVKSGREKEFMSFMRKKNRRAYRIGKIHCGSGVVLKSASGDEEISYQGYEHH